MRSAITNAILLGLAVVLLTLHIGIARFGMVILKEPNIRILAVETGLLASFIVLAIANLVKLAWDRAKQRSVLK